MAPLILVFGIGLAIAVNEKLILAPAFFAGMVSIDVGKQRPWANVLVQSFVDATINIIDAYGTASIGSKIDLNGNGFLIQPQDFPEQEFF